MGRPCSICCDSKTHRTVGEMIAAGASDQAVADRVGGVNRMAVARHRLNHVVAPAKALAEAAGKGRDAAEQRAQVIAAAEAGDPAAFVALSAIVADLQKVHARLERTADAAEQDNQRLTVASLSAQQLRATEVRAKMGGHGGYGQGKASPDGGQGVFSVNIHLGGKIVESISTVVPSNRVIDQELIDDE